jgi:hypothetical protein
LHTYPDMIDLDQTKYGEYRAKRTMLLLTTLAATRPGGGVGEVIEPEIKKRLQSMVIIEEMEPIWFQLIDEHVAGEGLPTMDPDQDFVVSQKIANDDFARELEFEQTVDEVVVWNVLSNVVDAQNPSELPAAETGIYTFLALHLSSSRIHVSNEQALTRAIAVAEDNIRDVLIQTNQPIPEWLSEVVRQVMQTLRDEF